MAKDKPLDLFPPEPPPIDLWEVDMETEWEHKAERLYFSPAQKRSLITLVFRLKHRADSGERCATTDRLVIRVPSTIWLMTEHEATELAPLDLFYVIRGRRASIVDVVRPIPDPNGEVRISPNGFSEVLLEALYRVDEE